MQKTLKGLESLNKAKKFHLIAEGNDPKEFANPFQRLTGKIMKSKFPDAYYCITFKFSRINTAIIKHFCFALILMLIYDSFSLFCLFVY